MRLWAWSVRLSPIFLVLVIAGTLVAPGTTAEKSPCSPLPTWEAGRPEFDGRELVRFDPKKPWDPAIIDPERSLLIRDPSVVDDPARTWDPAQALPGGGPRVWSLGHLLEQMAVSAGIDASDMVRRWLDHWTMETLSDNGITIQPEPSLIDKARQAWRIPPSGPFEVGRAPFRLLAIVNRLDLSRAPDQAGEVRFVFVAATGAPNQPPDSFTVIVELVPMMPAQVVAGRWKDLARYPLGTDTFNRELESLLGELTANALARLARGEPAVRLRTAKQVNGFRTWEYREFNVVRGTGIVITTTKQTPAEYLRGLGELGQWLNKNRDAVIQLKHDIPLRFDGGAPFLGFQGVLGSPGFWRIGVDDHELRHRFALDTCTGCHGHETLPSWFEAPFHVGSRGRGECSKLSSFLTGGATIADPSMGTPQRRFADILRRQVGLDDHIRGDGFDPLTVRLRGGMPSVH